MNKVTTMLDAAAAVITDIRSLADSLQVLVDAVSEGGTEGKVSAKKALQKKKPAEELKPESKQKKEKPLSLEDVRAVCAEKSREGFTAEVKEILTKHGADKLSEVDPTEYKALLAEVEALGNVE
ncbi:hypothetical protein MKC73_14025 [[Clostridium] innocuum]|nr:hypothetical protein [[Clostridium] innocuum]